MITTVDVETSWQVTSTGGHDVDEHAGKKYAANVPHGLVMSEIGKIPSEYIEET